MEQVRVKGANYSLVVLVHTRLKHVPLGYLATWSRPSKFLLLLPTRYSLSLAACCSHPVDTATPAATAGSTHLHFIAPYIRGPHRLQLPPTPTLGQGSRRDPSTSIGNFYLQAKLASPESLKRGKVEKCMASRGSLALF